MGSRAEIRLIFPGRVFSRRVGFRYEWMAFLIAYDITGSSPGEFAELDARERVSAVHYGAAKWDRICQGKKVSFTHNDMTAALNRAPMASNVLLANKMSETQLPEWYAKTLEEGDGDKKKA